MTRLLSITEASVTATSSVVILGNYLDSDDKDVTLHLAGTVASADGDRVKVQTQAPEASTWLDLHLDPLTVHSFIDGSGHFTAPGQVGVDAGRGTRMQVIYVPGVGGSSS
jgi:hypothetical protein